MSREKKDKHKEETHAKEEPILETLPSELELAKSEALDWKDKYFRALAELENYKKRAIEDSKKERKYASQDVSDKLIDSIDVFTQALQMQTEDPNFKNFLYGFRMIRDMIYKVLEDEGVKLVSVKEGDSFDPNTQHAIDTEEHLELADQSVLRVQKSGYLYKDRLLRPAMVVINVHPKMEELNDETTNEESLAKESVQNENESDPFVA
jgi:molecular chaperone GrpE